MLTPTDAAKLIVEHCAPLPPERRPLKEALDPAQPGGPASPAHATPLVHRAPRVAFLGSGDEIVDLDRAGEILAGRKVATSNSYTLFGLIRRAGGIPLDAGIAGDSRESLR